ncbi:MAG: hypothetical protein U1E62_00635 [Alsobacter sp.]
MAEPLLDLLEEVRNAMGHVSPEQAAARIAAALAGAPADQRFMLHRWFALRRSVAVSASERRFLDDVEALLLWAPEPAATGLSSPPCAGPRGIDRNRPCARDGAIPSTAGEGWMSGEAWAAASLRSSH